MLLSTLAHAHSYQGFRDAEYAFPHDGGVWKELLHVAVVQQPEFFDDVVVKEAFIFGAWMGKVLPNGEAMDDGALPRFRKVMDERQHDVHFEGCAAIGCLDPIGAADSFDLGGKALLIFEAADVFDNGVTEDDIEGLIPKGQQATIAGDVLHAGIAAVDGRWEI